MHTIWKFHVPFRDSIELKFPRDSTILSFSADQNGQMQLWVLVDPKQPKRIHPFRLFGTGHSIENYERLHFIGTAFTPGAFVWHLFQEAPDE